MTIAILLPLALQAAPVLSPAPAPVTVAEQAVTQEHGPQVVIIQARQFPQGVDSGWHVHPGVEIGYVVSGETVMTTAEGPKRYKAGESFVIPRGVVHKGGNDRPETTRMMVTLVVDAGVPPRSPSGPPTR